MAATTLGTGELIKDAILRGCRDILLGIGGSATNDAGTGMLQALGFRFKDKKGDVPGHGGEILNRIASIDESGGTAATEKLPVYGNMRRKQSAFRNERCGLCICSAKRRV